MATLVEEMRKSEVCEDQRVKGGKAELTARRLSDGWERWVLALMNAQTEQARILSCQSDARDREIRRGRKTQPRNSEMVRNRAMKWTDSRARS